MDEESFKPLDRLRKKLMVENLYIWILILLKEKKKYAYELRNDIKERFGFAPATVTSYAVLYKLNREGFVEIVEQNPFPNRKYYTITPKGEKLIEETKKVFQDLYFELFEENIEKDITKGN